MESRVVGENLKNPINYLRRLGAGVLVACSALAPSAGCSLAGDPVDHHAVAQLYCEGGDGNPNTNPAPEVSEVRDIDAGNPRAGGSLHPDTITFVCPEGTSAGIGSVLQKYSDEDSSNGDYRYNISIHCDGNVENPINSYRVGSLDNSGEDKRMIQIATNGFCDIVNIEGPNPVDVEDTKQ